MEWTIEKIHAKGLVCKRGIIGNQVTLVCSTVGTSGSWLMLNNGRQNVVEWAMDVIYTLIESGGRGSETAHLH